MDKNTVAPTGKEIKEVPKCPDGYVFCPMKKKCVPEGEQMSKGKGKGKARGQGKGPMGVPTKEADQLVDDILDGKYSHVKLTEKAQDMVDVILDMCGKDHGKKKKAIKEETEYQKFFKTTLQKFGVKSPAELEGEKKKEFFDAVDKGWKGNKEEVEEAVNAIDHVPNEEADEELSSIEDELGKEEDNRADETTEMLIKRVYNSVMEDISQEGQRVTHSDMKKKVAAAKVKCANVKDRDERTKCIHNHIKNSMKK